MPVLDFRTGKRLERRLDTAEEKKARPGRRNSSERTALLAKIHVAKKQLGLSDDEYRAMLDGHFGVDSAALLNLPDLRRMVLVMAEYGFSPRKRKDAPAALGALDNTGAATRDKPWTDDKKGFALLLSKIEALLAEKGREEGTDVPWAYAEAILRRLTRGLVSRLEDARAEELRGVIAALTYDAMRCGRKLA